MILDASLETGEESPDCRIPKAMRTHKVQAPAEQATPSFWCKCSVCDAQVKDKIHPESLALFEKDELANLEGRERSYTWLLEQLGEVTSQTAVKINVPETVVFRKGKPAFLIFQARDRLLKFTNSAEKLKLHEIRKLFSNTSRTRKREEASFLSRFAKAKLQASNEVYEPPGYGKETIVLRHMNRDKDNDNPEPKDEEGPLRVLLENEFAVLMYERAGSGIWKTISYIQSILKCKQGVGDSVVYTYYSHDANDWKAIEALRKAGQEDNEEEEEYLARNSPEEYCKLISRRIAYFLATYAQTELLRMKTEFMKDDNGKLWLTFASKISVRDIKVEQAETALTFKRVELISPTNRQNVLNELSMYTSKNLLSPNARRISDVMEEHYETIKSKSGINKLFDPEPPDAESNNAFSRLRPLIPYTLDQLLDPKLTSSIAEKHLQTPTRHSHSRRSYQPILTFTSTHRQSKSPGWTYVPRIRRSAYKSTSLSRNSLGS